MVKDKTKLQDKVALITGANRGIGLATARSLGKLGVNIMIGSRNRQNGEEAAAVLRSEGIQAEALLLDITSDVDRQKAYDFINQRYGKLDILINNASVQKEIEHLSPVNLTSTISTDLLRETFDSNFFSHVELTRQLLPLLRMAPAARIVNVSSILGSLNLQDNPDSPIRELKIFAYNASKTAINSFTIHLAHELKDTQIKVNSAHPGWVKTELGGQYAEMEVEDSPKTSVLLATLPDDGPTGKFFHLNEELPW
ncbi:SDR family oxidoreductase [Paenibacillus sp. P96]|uniref:SDR family oxidoreductase n=1 Tax=Paenibacillus zeirhizosphaerae TaxID=2987519 RepID=A0ABT9FPY4_9BACL|nr:SDR family oxidoreductase [Paenibacillus sp. P96]MDP4096798.1 SDR family oxidoreductase [Paenibacillus sp. P96]